MPLPVSNAVAFFPLGRTFCFQKKIDISKLPWYDFSVQVNIGRNVI